MIKTRLVERPPSETLRDSERLSYLLLRAAEKAYLMRNFKQLMLASPTMHPHDLRYIDFDEERKKNSKKLSETDDDLHKLLKKYGGRIVVCGPAGRFSDMRGKTQDGDGDLILHSGIIRSQISYTNAQFTLKTTEGLIDVDYALMEDDPRYTLPEPTLSVEIDFPASYEENIPLWQQKS